MTAADSKGLSAAIDQDPMDSFLWRVRADQSDDNGEGDAGRCRHVADVIDGFTKVKLKKPLLKRCQELAGYRGRKVKVTVATELTCYDTVADGGTVNRYITVVLGDFSGRSYYGLREGEKLAVTPGIARVVHSRFQGHDCGIEVFIHPFDISHHTETVE